MIVKGQKLNDRYEILKTIGEGGMANVYLAKDVILDRDVAIKVLRGDLANDEKFVRRFQREALSASSLSHPNIVEIYDVGEDDGDYFIAMEYIPGLNLKQLLKKRGSLTVHEVIDIMLQITSAMSVAHDSMIIHRDLKPQNILIMDDGGIKITDFGIAMALNSTQFTQTNSAMGSVHYFPPEQASGKGATLKSDVYSLGIMMYELLTGELPFKGDSAVEIALKHLKEPIPSVRKLNSSIPQSVENVIIKATAKNPKNRYNNANEMHDDLMTVLNKERLNEKPIELKYDEGIETKDYIATGDNLDNSLVKEIKTNDEKSNKKIIILASVAGALALILLFIFIVVPKLTEVDDVTIPDVSKLTQAEAEEKLKSKKLTVEIDVIEEASDTVDEGLVIGTKPAIGRSVKAGTKITLIVSSGIQKILIEDYTGQDGKEIKGKLEANGIIVTLEEKNVSNTDTKTYNENEILSQNVEKGTELVKGDKITLVIAKLEEKYPNFTNGSWGVSEIEKWAKEKGIVLTVSYIETDEYSPGTIISQSRGEDSIVVTGASLKIEVAKERQDTSNDKKDEESNTEKKEQ
mgnify:CR=1 FL=1